MIQKFVEFLPCSFGGKITLKEMSDKYVALIDCSLFEINSLLGWLTRLDLIDMLIELVLIKRSK